MEQDRTSENSPDAEARNAAAPNGTARPLDENPFVEGSEYWSWFQPLMEIWQEFREGAPHGVSTDAAGRFMKLVDHSGKGSSAKMAGVLRQGLEQDETHTIRCLSYFIPRFADEVGVSLV
jgi:hypothetical protein